ncbi:hypothetical protein HC256_000277 [Beauveria bassiana]|nr:hypothetical protein HC256_000277 [Beauveria bassiana]
MDIGAAPATQLVTPPERAKDGSHQIKIIETGDTNNAEDTENTEDGGSGQWISFPFGPSGSDFEFTSLREFKSFLHLQGLMLFDVLVHAFAPWRRNPGARKGGRFTVRDKPDMFLDKLHAAMHRHGSDLTSFFVQRSIYFTFFGQDIDIPVVDLHVTEGVHTFDYIVLPEQISPVASLRSQRLARTLGGDAREQALQSRVEEREARLHQLAMQEQQFAANAEQLQNDFTAQNRRILALRDEERDTLARLSSLQHAEVEQVVEQVLRLETLQADEQNKQSEIAELEQRRANLGEEIRLDLLATSENGQAGTAGQERGCLNPMHHCARRRHLRWNSWWQRRQDCKLWWLTSHCKSADSMTTGSARFHLWQRWKHSIYLQSRASLLKSQHCEAKLNSWVRYCNSSKLGFMRRRRARKTLVTRSVLQWTAEFSPRRRRRREQGVMAATKLKRVVLQAGNRPGLLWSTWCGKLYTRMIRFQMHQMPLGMQGFDDHLRHLCPLTSSW